jgi:predicted nucleic acid-binding protein
VIVVDSSAWIDFFRGIQTPETDRLFQLAATTFLATGDLIAVEVLQGVKDDAEFNLVEARLNSLIMLQLGGKTVAFQAAQNFRKLRSMGITVRKTIDTIIATYCIQHGHELLFSDRDFDPFVTHLGLRSAMTRLKGP